MKIKVLLKYHVVYLVLFVGLLISIFYIHEGGTLETPAPLAVLYIISAVLMYVPLVLVLTVFNLLILTVGFLAFKNRLYQFLTCLVPVVLFSFWYIKSGDELIFTAWNITIFQFYSIILLWIVLLVIGLSLNGNFKPYVRVLSLPLLIVVSLFLAQFFNFTPSGLRIRTFHFRTVVTIWTLLNCGIFIRIVRQRLYHQTSPVQKSN